MLSDDLFCHRIHHLEFKFVFHKPFVESSNCNRFERDVVEVDPLTGIKACMEIFRHLFGGTRVNIIRMDFSMKFDLIDSFMGWFALISAT